MNQENKTIKNLNKIIDNYSDITRNSVVCVQTNKYGHLTISGVEETVFLDEDDCRRYAELFERLADALKEQDE